PVALTTGIAGVTRPAAIAQRLRPEDVQSAVDAVLTEHDAYVPLQLLLLLGLLEQADHAAWRCGDMAYLPATLTAAQPVVRILRIAASWAQELGLEPEQQICYGMGKQTGRQLRFCASDTDECAALLATRYVRASRLLQAVKWICFSTAGQRSRCGNCVRPCARRMRMPPDPLLPIWSPKPRSIVCGHRRANCWMLCLPWIQGFCRARLPRSWHIWSGR